MKNRELFHFTCFDDILHSLFIILYSISMTTKKVLLFLFLFALTLQTARSATLEDLEARLNALHQKDAELQKQSQSYQKMVDKAQSQVRTIKGDINDLSYQISNLTNEISRTDNSIERATLEIEKFALEIQKIFEEIDETKRQTSKLLSKLYRFERVSSAELIISGQSFSDFWDAQQYLANFQSSFNTLFSQMQLLGKELSQKKQDQEAQKAELEGLKKQKELQQGILDQERGDQKTLLAQNQQEQQRYQSQVVQTEKTRQNIIKEILNIEAEVKRLRNFSFYLKSGKIPPAGTKIFAWPVDGPVTQGYGGTAFARSGIAGYRFHNGIDTGGGIGTIVKAAAPGNVIGRNTDACPNYGRLRSFGCQGGWGNWIAIKHSDNVVTLYGHLAQPSTLAVGQDVPVGNELGYIGSSGNVTGPHLHFSVYTEFFLVPAGYPGYNPEGTVNPLLYL